MTIVLKFLDIDLLNKFIDLIKMGKNLKFGCVLFKQISLNQKLT
jgi:hypothetical protein